MSDQEEDTGGITAADLAGEQEQNNTTAPPVSEEVKEKESELDPSMFQDFDLGEDEKGQEEGQKPAESTEELPTDAPAIAKQLKDKYPTIFKDIPGLRKALFAGPQVLEIFPTPEEAKTAYQRLEAMDQLVSRVVDHADVGTLLDHIYQAEPGAIKAVSDNFLPALYQKSPDLFKSAVRPVFSSVIKEMIRTAESNNNKNLYITAKNFCQWMFGSAEPPEMDQPRHSNAPDPEKQRLQESNQQLNEVLAKNFLASVNTSTNSLLESEVSNRLDPKNAIPAGLRKMVVKQAVEEVRNNLRADQQHKNRIALLSQRAAKENYPDAHKQGIIEAYMSSARAAIPGIVQKIRAELVARAGNGKQQTNPRQQAAQQRTRNDKGEFTEAPVNSKSVDWSKYPKAADFLFAEKVAVKQ